MSFHSEPNVPEIAFEDLFDVDEKRFSGSQFILETIRAFQRAFTEEKDKNRLSQQAIADKLGLAHKSIVSRWLSGKENMTSRTIGELAWALDKKAVIRLEPRGEPTQSLEKIVDQRVKVIVPDDTGAWRKFPTSIDSESVLENV